MAVALVQAENFMLEDLPEYDNAGSINIIGNAKTWLNPAVPYS